MGDCERVDSSLYFISLGAWLVAQGSARTRSVCMCWFNVLIELIFLRNEYVRFNALC